MARFWQFHKIVGKESLRVEQPTLRLNQLWSVKYSQRCSNTIFSYVRELTIELQRSLHYIMDYIYKIELNLSNIGDVWQLSSGLNSHIGSVVP